MSMKIYGDKGVSPIEGIKRSRKNEGATEGKGSSPQDRVDFSAMLQDVHRARETAAAREIPRADKVRALKAQIDSGSYRPDLEKVAASLLKFIAEDQ